MLIVISPAKTLDYESPLSTEMLSQPDYLGDSGQLIRILSEYTPLELEKLMHISPKLAELNMGRYLDWHTPFTLGNARQAALAFKGDVYLGLDAATIFDQDWEWAQGHLRILSGLYGLLRPLDLIQPYRLEMGTKLENLRGKNLYEFWGDQISEGLNRQLEAINSETLVNLASNEYFKSVKLKSLDAHVLTPVFKDWKNGEYKIISFFAKKARGLMSRWIIENRIGKEERIADFDVDGYCYDPESSTDDMPVFLRRLP
ncbi:MAG: peroxide stress protein YaaA [Gammaproteobacteria bacterium]|nr:peroxide stress protein YaaA [Gammaproteobacteria bacterium]